MSLSTKGTSADVHVWKRMLPHSHNTCHLILPHLQNLIFKKIHKIPQKFCLQHFCCRIWINFAAMAWLLIQWNRGRLPIAELFSFPWMFFIYLTLRKPPNITNSSQERNLNSLLSILCIWHTFRLLFQPCHLLIQFPTLFECSILVEVGQNAYNLDYKILIRKSEKGSCNSFY